MKQGVLLPSRVRLLLSKGHSCYRPRRTGERKRKSVRGCIVGSDMSVLSVTIVKQGEQDLPGLTDTTVPKRLGPKRANNIRKFFVRYLPASFFATRDLPVSFVEIEALASWIAGSACTRIFDYLMDTKAAFEHYI